MASFSNGFVVFLLFLTNSFAFLLKGSLKHCNGFGSCGRPSGKAFVAC